MTSAPAGDCIPDRKVPPREGGEQESISRRPKRRLGATMAIVIQQKNWLGGVSLIRAYVLWKREIAPAFH